MEKSKVDLLVKEYSDWLEANVSKEYRESQCCSADSILWDSIELGLNDEQRSWLRKFITRWEKAYL